MADTEVLAQAMQTKMPSNPVDRVVQQRADVAEKKAGIDADVAQKSMDLNAPIDTAYKGKVEDTQQLLSSIGKQTEKPFQLPQETTADFAELGGLVAVVGVMLGSSGKMSANNVLGSITGLMEGYKKGRADVVANSYKEFETNMKRLQTQAQNATAQLDNYTKLVAVDREAANRVLAQFKAEQNQGIASESSKAESGFDAIKTKAELQKMANHQAELTQKVKADAIKAMTEHKMYDPVAKTWMGFDTKTMSYQPISGSEGLITEAATKPVGGAGGAAQVTATRVMQQDIGNANYNMQELMEIGKDTGKYPGGSPAFANHFKGDISADIQRYLRGEVIDPNLQTNDALLLNLAFDIASAQTGGRGQLSDAKVRAIVSQLPLDNQPEEVKKAMWNATFNRVLEANNSMPEDKRVSIPKNVEAYFAKGGGSNKRPVPTEQEFIEKVSAVNPNMTPAQIKAKYKELYGSK